MPPPRGPTQVSQVSTTNPDDTIMSPIEERIFGPAWVRSLRDQATETRGAQASTNSRAAMAIARRSPAVRPGASPDQGAGRQGAASHSTPQRSGRVASSSAGSPAQCASGYVGGTPGTGTPGTAASAETTSSTPVSHLTVHTHGGCRGWCVGCVARCLLVDAVWHEECPVQGPGPGALGNKKHSAIQIRMRNPIASTRSAHSPASPATVVPLNTAADSPPAQPIGVGSRLTRGPDRLWLQLSTQSSARGPLAAASVSPARVMNHHEGGSSAGTGGGSDGQHALTPSDGATLSTTHELPPSAERDSGLHSSMAQTPSSLMVTLRPGATMTSSASPGSGSHPLSDRQPQQLGGADAHQPPHQPPHQPITPASPVQPNFYGAGQLDECETPCHGLGPAPAAELVQQWRDRCFSVTTHGPDMTAVDNALSDPTQAQSASRGQIPGGWAYSDGFGTGTGVPALAVHTQLQPPTTISPGTIPATVPPQQEGPRPAALPHLSSETDPTTTRTASRQDSSDIEQLLIRSNAPVRQGGTSECPTGPPAGPRVVFGGVGLEESQSGDRIVAQIVARAAVSSAASTGSRSAVSTCSASTEAGVTTTKAELSPVTVSAVASASQVDATQAGQSTVTPFMDNAPDDTTNGGVHAAASSETTASPASACRPGEGGTEGASGEWAAGGGEAHPEGDTIPASGRSPWVGPEGRR